MSSGAGTDGYHLLDSLVVFAGVGDRLSVSPADRLSLSVTGPFAAGLAAEADNLVLRAARALAAQAGIRPPGRWCWKRTCRSPPASAADRRMPRRRCGCCAGSGAWIARRRWTRWRGGLGADVPVCLAGRPALMSGIGEVLAPAPALPEIGMVLVNPGVAVATPAVFRARSGGRSPTRRASPRVVGGTPIRWLRRCTPPAMTWNRRLVCWRPSLARCWTRWRRPPGCLLARMSGSGATCFGLFADPQAARAAARAIVP